MFEMTDVMGYSPAWETVRIDQIIFSYGPLYSLLIFFVLVDATLNHKPVALGRGGIFVVSNERLGWKNSRVSILFPGMSVAEKWSVITIDHYFSSQRWQCPSHSDCQCVDHDADFSQTVLSTHRVDVVWSLGAVVRKTPWIHRRDTFSFSVFKFFSSCRVFVAYCF